MKAIDMGKLPTVMKIAMSSGKEVFITENHR